MNWIDFHCLVKYWFLFATLKRTFYERFGAIYYQHLSILLQHRNRSSAFNRNWTYLLPLYWLSLRHHVIIEIHHVTYKDIWLKESDEDYLNLFKLTALSCFVWNEIHLFRHIDKIFSRWMFSCKGKCVPWI